MIRRKAKEYGGYSLELGGATNLIKYVPMKRRMSINIVRYLILILLGVIIHAGYKLMVNVRITITQHVKSGGFSRISLIIRSFVVVHD